MGIFGKMPTPSSSPSFVQPQLGLPAIQPNVREKNGQWEIQCLSRQRFVRLEPEEWVRQHWLAYLANQLGYPSGMISAEYGLKLNGMTRRADIVCHNHEGRPVLMVECKSPAIAVRQDTLNQVLRYHIALEVPVLVISNGVQHHAYDMRKKPPQTLDQIPSLKDLGAPPETDGNR